MSVKLPKRLSSKKKRSPSENAQVEIFHKLGLETYRTQLLDSTSVLDISTWATENPAPLELKDLPNDFLRRLWMLRQDARNSCCQSQHHSLINDNNQPKEKLDGFEGKSQNAINPLDLVTSIFIAANPFLQQDMFVQMSQCKFAVPLVLPSLDPEEPSKFLLWPSRGVMSQWRCHSLESNMTVQNWNLASTSMPMVSCVKLGCCSVSKSRVLNYVLNGVGSCFETFVHKGMDGGQLPQRLSNGLIEIGWHLPTGEVRDMYPVPLAISNLHGDVSAHEKHLKLLCQISSAVIVFCGDFTEKGKQLLLSCRDMKIKLILIDLSGSEDSTVGSVGQSLEQQTGLPEVSVLSGIDLSEEEVASKLNEILKNWLPDKLKLVSLEAAAEFALELGLNVDEGPVCKKAMALAEDVLKGLDEGPAEFRVKQLPLQGPLWSKLSEIDREEGKKSKDEKEMDPQLQTKRKDILTDLSKYKMTPAMKTFTNALCTTNKVERTFFLNWLKLRLHLMQTEKQKSLHESLTNMEQENLEDEANSSEWDIDSLCTVSIFEEEDEGRPVNTDLQLCEQQLVQEEILLFTETNIACQSQQTDQLEQVTAQEAHVKDEISLQVKDQRVHLDSGESGTLSCKEKHSDQSELVSAVLNSTSSTTQQVDHEESFETQLASRSQSFEHNSFTLGLEHFLREMGLIFELTKPRRSQNVLRLPSLATDLLLCGVPLELMDGDASNVPTLWLGCVFAELERQIHLKQLRTRVLTSLGVYHARNAEVLSALFGVKFPRGSARTSRGVYMIPLFVPDYIRKEAECDFLLLIDVGGLCSVSANKTNLLMRDEIMATFATGLSDVLLQNISPLGEKDFETTLTLTVNALLRTKECGSLPFWQILTQDNGINSRLHASQLKLISKMLQTDDKGNVNHAKTTNCVTSIKGPSFNVHFSESVDMHYSKAMLKLKKNLIEALKRCADRSEAPNLMEILGRLHAVWDAVKSDSFSISLQNTKVAVAFSSLCTKFSHWENCFLQNMESWLIEATKKISATTNALDDGAVQQDLLNELKNEAQEEVKSEVNEVKSKLEVYLLEDEILKTSNEALRPVLMSNISNLQNRAMNKSAQKLETFNKSHCLATQIKKFETLLEKEQELKLAALVETSKSTKIILQDSELEEEFEPVWKMTLSNFDFRPSVTESITSRVTDVLKQNIISRGLQKHIHKLVVCDQNQTSDFQVFDEHFGYRSRLKHMFEDNNRQQRLEAQQVACKIIEECNQFVADKCCLPADFSDSYIVELLENAENTLREKSLNIRSAFEVDLKVYICNKACQIFQKLHNRYAKDTELLTCISATKTKYIAQFIYQFRKKDQCQRMAQAFFSMVIKPTVLDYISRSIAREIAEEIKNETKKYDSPHAFQKSLLEELVKEDRFESFVECLLYYDDFKLRKIQKAVDDHLLESTSLSKWRLQKLGEIVGKVAAAVSQTTVAAEDVLSGVKPLLQRVCLILERDVDVKVHKTFLNGPLFSITTDWHSFVKRLMDLLATMWRDLSQEFSQNVDIGQFLNCLPVQSQEHLLRKITGCDKRCPLCKAPCEEEELGHEVHKSSLHRPKGMLPYDSCSLLCISCPESMEPDYNQDIHEAIMTCTNLSSLHTNWSNFSDDPNSQKVNNYWRYVLVRFNERFAVKFNQRPAKIPEEWRMITQEEALKSLNTVFPNKDGC